MGGSSDFQRNLCQGVTFLKTVQYTGKSLWSYLLPKSRKKDA